MFTGKQCCVFIEFKLLIFLLLVGFLSLLYTLVHEEEKKKLFKEYRLMGVFNNHTSLEEKPWGSLEFTIYDPFKNELVFYQMI